jgi:hypothetical protein
MFKLFSQTYVASMFIWMLHIFHTYVASILSGCCVCCTWFSSVFRCFCKCFIQMHVLSISAAFRRILQMLHLDVSKVDWVLHLAPSSSLAASPRCLHLLSAPAGQLIQKRRQAPPAPLLDGGGAAWDGGTAEAGLPRVARTGAPSVPWSRYASGRVLLLLRYSVVS